MDQKKEHVSARELLPAAIIAAGQIVAAEIAQGRMRYEPNNLDSVSSPMYELVWKLVEDARRMASMYNDKAE